MRIRSVMCIAVLSACTATESATTPMNGSASNEHRQIPSDSLNTSPQPVEQPCWTADPPSGREIVFEDVTDTNGLVEPLTGMYGHAVASADVNGDGWTDLFVSGFADRPTEDYQVRGAEGPSPDQLLLGGSNGFVVDRSFPGELARTSGAVFADLDNDDDLDLVVVRNPRDTSEIGRRPSAIFENRNGTWAKASELTEPIAGRSVAAIDVDRDGLLDLAIAADRFGDGGSRLYKNAGGIAFADATSEWGMPDDLHGLALVDIDLNDDGWIDLVTSGDERVLLGAPSGFTVTTVPAFRWTTYGNEDDAAGIAAGDLDLDGRPDLVVGQHFNSTLDLNEEVAVRIFLNRSAGDTVDLLDVTDSAGSPPLRTKSPHVAIADVDNDGRLDIVTSAETTDGTPLIMRNTTSNAVRFEPNGEPAEGTYWVTGATDDFDHDGQTEIFVVAWEPESESKLFHMEGSPGHWVSVDLTSFGREASGAVVEVRGAADDEFIQRAWLTSTTGYASGSPLAVHVGLGAVHEPLRISITTLSGITETFTALPDGRYAPHGC